MPGGPKEAYERVRPIFEASAAKVNGDPCVTWLGPGSAGHFVKMVHNGIEYGIMQLTLMSGSILRAFSYGMGEGVNIMQTKDKLEPTIFVFLAAAVT